MLLETKPDLELYLEVNNESIFTQQRNCEECKELATLVRDSGAVQSSRTSIQVYAKRCKLINDLLVTPDHVGGERLVPVAPKSLREPIIEAAHIDMMGHLKNPRLYHLIATRVGWPGMRSEIDKYLTKCQVFLNFNVGRVVQPPPAAFQATNLFEHVIIDVMHMKHTSEGYCSILAAIDVLSRMAWAVPL